MSEKNLKYRDRKRMGYGESEEFLTKHRFSLIGLMIYIAPSFVLFGYILITLPPGGASGPYPSTETAPFFEVALGAVMLMILLFAFVATPLLLLISRWWLMIPYFVVAYALLYVYWRRQQRKSIEQKDFVMAHTQRANP